MDRIEEQINKLIEDVKKKAEVEARYYQGAVDSLVLLLNNLEPNTEVEDRASVEQYLEEIKDSNGASKSRKRSKP